MKDNTKCSNPSASSAPAKPAAAVAAPALPHNALLNQVVLLLGQYVMYLRAAPPPGSPASDPFPPPFPPTPHDALKMTHGKLLGQVNELVLTSNKDPSANPNFKGSCQTLKDQVARQVELTKTPITDGLIYNSLQSDIFNLTNNAIEMVSHYEESVVSRSLSTHIEKLTAALRASEAGGSGQPWEPYELIVEFLKLARNVMTQLLYISDPEKSKNTSDNLLSLSKSFHAFMQSKNGPKTYSRAPAPDPGAHIRTIADNIRKLHSTMAQSGASSALFPDEEMEVFDSATTFFDEVLALSASFNVKRPVQILLSELAYVKEASFSSPPDRDVLLNCALFIHCTCNRIAQKHREGKLKENVKKVLEHVAGLLTLCGNFVVMVAGALVAKNKSYQYVHLGYALRAIAFASSVLADPVYGIAI